MSVLALFHDSELLLLFTVLLTGLLLGRIRVLGFSLGVSGVLFSGIFFGAWHEPGRPPLHIAHTLRDFGLVLFVYAVGLTSGPGFFRAFARRGLSLNLAVVGALIAGAVLTVTLGGVMGLPAGVVAGAYCGSLTNTPALAAVVEQARASLQPAAPTLGYSVTYPFGVIGALLLAQVLVRLRRQTYQRELREEQDHTDSAVGSTNLRVENPDVCGQAIGALRIRDTTGLLISRVRHDGETFVPTKYNVLHEGDIVTVVGSPEALRKGETCIGPHSSEEIDASRHDVDVRRILVSRKDLVGCRIGDLELDTKYHAQVTRLRRADLDIAPTEDTRLERGDRLRVVAPAHNLPALGKFFGDSTRDASIIDFVGLALGIVLGLAVGEIPIPTPGGVLRLGIAGGPLLVALLLGHRGRTGPFLWSLPYESNLAVRELGLLLFLAAVGTTAGEQLSSATGRSGLQILLLGGAVTVITNGILLVVLAKWVQSGVFTSLGVASALQTQPATLAAAHELSERSDEVYVAYAVAYPTAMVGKILLAQVVYFFVAGGSPGG